MLDQTFSALGDPTRRAIVERLARGPASIGQLAEPFAMSLAAVSKHVTVLEDAGLVARRKRGRVVECTVRTAPMRDALAWIERAQRWSRRLDRLGRFLEGET